MVKTGIVGLAALALAACAGNAERIAQAERKELAKTLAGRTSGVPVDCVQASSTAGGSARVVDGALLYRNGGRLWRNDGPRCVGGTNDPIVILEVYGSQLCRNDRYRTLPRGSGIAGPFCRMGRWIPYVKGRSG